MAITTMDQLTAALASARGLNNVPPFFKNALSGTFAAGNLVSLWTATGLPAAGAAAGSAAGAACDVTTTGAVKWNNPASGSSYLARLLSAADIVGTLYVYDRLVHTSALAGNLNTAQTVTSATLPSRPDTNGAQTELFMEVYTAIGATPTTVTCSYTDQDGNTGNTSGAGTVGASLPAGALVPIPLAAGDSGVRAVASLTLAASTGTAGNLGITIARRLAEIPIPAVNVGQVMDSFLSGLSQIYNSACLWFVYLIGSGTAAPNIRPGSLTIVQG